MEVSVDTDSRTCSQACLNQNNIRKRSLCPCIRMHRNGCLDCSWMRPGNKSCSMSGRKQRPADQNRTIREIRKKQEIFATHEYQQHHCCKAEEKTRDGGTGGHRKVWQSLLSLREVKSVFLNKGPRGGWVLTEVMGSCWR